MTTPAERPYKASEYDKRIVQTIPFSREIYMQSISIIAHYGNTDGKLLDVGCGTGMFEQLLRERFPQMELVGIDPAEDMLGQAISRNVERVTYHQATIMDLAEAQSYDRDLGIAQSSGMDLAEAQSYDIVTALMSHHFIKPENRKEVLGRVYDVLKPGGIYIAFENVLPGDDFLKEGELNRWAHYQIQAGKPAEEAAVHKARCGVYYYPLTVEQHQANLKEAGFSHVYVYWRSYMQMGIMAIK